MKQLIFMFFTLLVIVSYGQTSTDISFEKNAIKYDSLFTDAYKKNDINTYNKLLTDFSSKYVELSVVDKKKFSKMVPGVYYNLCRIYSLKNNKEMAITYLKKSIDAGYFNYTHIQHDSDLDKLRNLKEFKTIVGPLKKIGDYLYILRHAGKYNPDDKRILPKFTYQSSDNHNLLTLRNKFKLDSIAGTGNEISKIINVMHWIHYLIPHDGNHGNPVVKNAMSMITECKRDSRGLNCRGLATVLNECYLSLGIKSRIITCLPKDSLKIDQDCHVINMVYSDLLKKWLWIDPSFDAYVMNEKGELLSIKEVRERIINNQPLIINPDANWNRKTSQSKENYLYSYMAKNLYLLECPLNSQYDMETMDSGKTITYIRLLPLDYFNQSPDRTESNGTNTKMVFYKTNNPTLFWQKP